MARTSFGRTVIKTICEVTYYDKENVEQHTTVDIYGNYSIENAVKPVKESLGTNRFVIDSIKHVSFYGRMTFEDFSKVCTKSNEKEW